MGKRSAPSSRTASRCWFRLRRGDRKRMPEYNPLHVARSTVQEKAEGLCAVGRIEREAVLPREPRGRLPVRGRMPVALPQPVNDVEGARSGERYAATCEQAPRGAREPRRPPAVGDHPRCYTNPHDSRGPTERADGEGEARGRTAGAERQDDRIGRRVDLGGE